MTADTVSHDVRVVARGVAVSDLHLGYRALRAEVLGRNQREIDVEIAWRRIVDRILELHGDSDIDLVTIAGDMFHNTRPSFYAVKAYRDGIRRLIDRGIRVVAVQGNHDGPKSTDSLNPAIVPDDMRGYYFVDRPEVVQIETQDWLLNVACFPYCVLVPDASWKVEPNPSADVNLLVIHGAVKTSTSDALPYFYAGGEALDVGAEAGRWDVIACGDWHGHRALHPDHAAFYSGAIERTTSNIWDEVGPKGLVVWEVMRGPLGEGERSQYVNWSFEEIVTRPVHDYDLGDFLDVPGPNVVDDVNFALRQIVGSDLFDDAHMKPIVRLRVYGLDHRQRDQVDRALVDLIRAGCLHFDLDYREKAGGVGGPVSRDESTGERRTLADSAIGFFAGDELGVRESCLDYLGIARGPVVTENAAPAAEATETA